MYKRQDPDTPDGAAITIEDRAEDEVLAGGPAWNPAFDVTPAELITAIVTDRGVLAPRDVTRAID